MKRKVKNSKSKHLSKDEENKAIEELKNAVKSFDESTLSSISKFQELPLSALTQKGLRESYFSDLTSIQKQAIVPCLQGKDLLGAAKTGSGKTLAFLIPVLERLYLEKWSQSDGLGALIISPTRELAIQIFDVLRKIGRFHQFSAGLMVGGKDIKQERTRIGRLNILVCTPGRLLQHMDESPDFDALNLQILVLDEADRILDMGFKSTVDAIVSNLSPERQTLLFSATQTKSVSDLARLSLVNPKYVSVDAENPSATPKDLEQYYTICKLEDKLDLLWSFLRTHTKAKILVFLSSSKQVRFVFEAFRRLRPGIPLLHLHGRQKQMARIEATKNFSHSRASCLIATDVVARGMDFPEVDWVIQLDCPEDTATYIHRVGRSARAGKSGRALLFLAPTEQSFVQTLQARKVPINKLDIRENKKSSIQPDLQAQCFQDPELKYLAQKAFISYVRSVHIQKDKEVFKVGELDLEPFAKSFGLASAPNVKIKGEAVKNQLKNQPRALIEPKAKDDRIRTKYDRMFERQNQDVLSEHYKKLSKSNQEDDDDDFMTLRREGHDIDEDKTPQLLDLPESKRAIKRALSKKATAVTKGGNHTKLIFDDDGEAHPIYEFRDENDFTADGDAETQRQGFLAEESQKMVTHDTEDKELAKQKRDEKKRRRKELERQIDEYSGSEDEAIEVRLPSESESASEYDREQERHAPKAKKPKYSSKPKLIEVEQPQSLADLEALSASLLRG